MIRVTGVTSLVLAALTLVGCDQAESDMGDQRKVEAYDASAAFADGASLRPAVAGTVPRDSPPGQPYGTLRSSVAAGGESWRPASASMPLTVDAAMIDRGQTAFDVHCATCHGRLGNGNGMIVQRGFPMPPSFHVPRLRAASDAHLFNVITHGYGAMYGYGDRVTPDERWAIVAYVRALQVAPDRSPSALSDGDRATLLIGGDANAALVLEPPLEARVNDALRGTPLYRSLRPALLLGCAASGVLVVAGCVDAPHFFRAYLLGWLLWLGAALGAMAMLMIHHLTGGQWGWPLRRPAEAMTATLPLVSIAALPLLLGLHHVFPWADAERVSHDALLQHRRSLMNVPFTLARAATFLAMWSLIGWSLRHASRAYDSTGDERCAGRARTISAVGLVVYFVTMSLASVDWIASREVDWYSSTFGLITVLGQSVTGLATLIVALACVRDVPAVRAMVRERTVHDLGNLLQTVVVLWAYVSFMQYLVIWIGNTQDEAIWFHHRTTGGWTWVGRALIALGFALPFVLLLFQRAKRDLRTLAHISAGVLIVRGVDLLWTIVPSSAQAAPNRIYWLDFVGLIAMGALGWSCFAWQLARTPDVPHQVAKDQSDEPSNDAQTAAS